MATRPPVPIHIEAVQWTPGHEPVIVHYVGKGVKGGPLSKTSLFHTTQEDLGGDSWGDEEVHTALLAHLDENGIAAEIASPDLPAPTPEGTGVIPAKESAKGA